ncbi:PTS system fructose-like transporter subunit IIB 2 [Klebsiella michiganensis]|uniref:protein-N(pi)-phosphohistidine--D-fructose phosphotransferase n=1 Tax=Klebsiella michiganensis TaxID=1134687 RepID=A0A7H4LVE7_9ENTR|nr:PTS system fructose-like transporter subunit IIB 2 [Klebsiella michiganensis]
MDFTIVAVTACVSGVAHTYMAAERLEKVGHQEKWNIKIETQGALGWRTK